MIAILFSFRFIHWWQGQLQAEISKKILIFMFKSKSRCHRSHWNRFWHPQCGIQIRWLAAVTRPAWENGRLKLQKCHQLQVNRPFWLVVWLRLKNMRPCHCPLRLHLRSPMDISTLPLKPNEFSTLFTAQNEILNNSIRLDSLLFNIFP